MLAENVKTEEEIAAEVGVSYRTIVNWRRIPDFQAKIAEHLQTVLKAIEDLGISQQRFRVDQANTRHRLLRQIVAARAEHYKNRPDAPGADTGFLIERTKVFGSGRNIQVTKEFVLDTDLLRELSNLEVQVAKDLGQWVKKAEVSGNPDNPIKFTITIDGVRHTPEQLRERQFIEGALVQTALDDDDDLEEED